MMAAAIVGHTVLLDAAFQVNRLRLY